MNIVKNIAKASLLLLLCSFSAYAQSIRLVRSDADTSRAHFVTATYMFGVDVVLDSISRVNGVAFELRHNLAESVQFSGWEARSFATKNTIVISQPNAAVGMSSISIGILTGRNSSQPGIDSPTVIHLDFVVAPDALHNANLVFTFVNPQAVTGGDSSRIVTLQPVTPAYNVHSFVDVWPGDTDNNGVVDTRDVAQIGLYVGAGSSESSLRGFKRIQPSALWLAQQALAWDSTAITFADADGNGTVTARDMLVVLANFGKSRSTAILAGNGTNSPDMEYIPERKRLFSPGYERIPLRVAGNHSTIGVSGRIPLVELQEDFIIHGLEKGDIFAGTDSYLWYDENISKNILEFAVGTTSRTEVSTNGIAAYLIVERKNPSAYARLRADELTGISTAGYLFPLMVSSSAGENDPAAAESVSLLQTSSTLELLSGSDEEIFVTLSNSLGEELLAGERLAPYAGISVPTGNFPQGIYFLTLRAKGFSTVRKVALTR